MGTTNRTRLADYRRALTDDTALVLKVHQSNYRIVGFTEAAVGGRAGRPRAARRWSTSGRACSTRPRPWLAGGPPAWLAGEPAVRQTLAAGAALVTFSGDKLLGGPQAGIIAGRARPGRPLRPPPPGPGPAARRLVLAALQDTALAYLRRDGAGHPVLAHGHHRRSTTLRARAARPRRPATPVRLRQRARRGLAARPGDPVGRRRRRRATTPPRLRALGSPDRRPGPRRARPCSTCAPSTRPTTPGWPRPWPPCRAEPCTSSPPPATSTTASRRSSWPSPASTPTASPRRRRGASPSTSASPGPTLPSGRQLAFVDVPGHVRFIRNMLAGVGAVDACLFVVAATEGWKPQSEEHLRILELLGIDHGIIALTKVGLVDDEWRELARMEVEDRVAGTFLAGAEVVEVDAPTGVGVDELRAALDRLLAADPDRGRPRPAPAVGRPVVRGQGLGHRRDRHAGRRHVRASTTSCCCWTGTRAAGSGSGPCRATSARRPRSGPATAWPST